MEKLAILLHYHDLRVTDHPSLIQASKKDIPVLPIFILDGINLRSLGGASKWWLHYALQRLAIDYSGLGGRLHLFKDDTITVLNLLKAQFSEKQLEIHVSYDPDPLHRKLVDRLLSLGFELVVHNSNQLFEAGTVLNQQGKVYQVFTPFWKAMQQRSDEWLDGDKNDAAVTNKLVSVNLDSIQLDDLELLPKIKWDQGFHEYWQPPKPAKWFWKEFLNCIESYATRRDIPSDFATSHLSPYLAWGEVSPRQLYASLLRRNMHGRTEPWIRQLGWREFAVHLMHHFPHSVNRPLRPEYESFPNRQQRSDFDKWKHGNTGFPIVDAGMRQLWRTGWMHNRVRMITASFLVKQMLLPWQWGAEWFEDTLVDFDLANNTMGWQWSAGCGADAAPYFRIFNPLLQSQKFDKDGGYIKEWIPELSSLNSSAIHEPYKAGLLATKLNYPAPILDLKETRQRALDAYQQMRQLNA